jgi:folate-binding Fe-S cluster repair protein YgfZ
VVKVVGDDARRFLNGLVTNDVAKVAPGKPAPLPRCSRRKARSSSISSLPKRYPRMAAAFFSIARAHWRRISWKSSTSTNCAQR